MTTYNFFVLCPENGFQVFETLNEALDAANERIKCYLADCWSEDVTSVCAGKITHRAKMCDQVFPDGEIDEDGIDEAGEPWDPDWEYKCNYKMLPDNTSDDVTKLVDPSAWLVREKTFCGDVTTDKDAADFWEQLSPRSTTPLYAHPQQATEVAKLLEVLELFMVNPTPTGEDFDKARAAIADYRKHCGDV